MASYVQSRKSVPGTSTGVTLAYNSNVTLGNLLVVLIYIGGTGRTVTDVHDSVGGSGVQWTRLGGITQSSDGHQIDMWWTTAPATGALSVTVGWVTSTANSYIAIIEDASPYVSLASGSPVTATGGAGSALVNAGSLDISPKSNGTIIMGVGGAGSGTTCDGTPYGFNATRETILNGSVFAGAILDRDQASAASFACKSDVTSQAWSAIAGAWVSTQSISGPFPVFRPDLP